jgi:hypothetical protein
MKSPQLMELINLFLCLYVIMVRRSSACPYSYLPLPFPCTDEVVALACSPTDELLEASGCKDDKGFLWRIGSAEGALKLTGIACFLSLLLCFVCNMTGISLHSSNFGIHFHMFLSLKNIYPLFL